MTNERSGLQNQVMFAVEGTPGTFQTPTVALPLKKSTIKRTQPKLVSKAVYPGKRTQRTTQWRQGAVTVAGDLTFELPNRSAGKLLLTLLGHVAITGSGPYTQVFTEDNVYGRTLTIQVGVTQTTGTVTPWTFTGCKVTKIVLNIVSDDLTELVVSVVGQDGSTGTHALASATFADGLLPFSYYDLVVTYGEATLNVKSGSVTIESVQNTSRRFAGTKTIFEPIRNGLAVPTAAIVFEYDGTDRDDAQIAGTEDALTFAWTNDAGDSFTITGNARIDGDPPDADGMDVQQQTTTFVYDSPDGDDANTVSVTTVNGDSAA